MLVLVIGGGRTGSHLTSLLLSQGHKVRVIEHRPDALANIHCELPSEVVFEGEGSDPQVLEAAGIQQAQVLAAVTSDDAENLVIARINNPMHAWLFTREMGVDVALNQADLMARMIEEEMSLGDMMTLLKLHRGKFSLVEEKIYHGAKAAGIAIKDLKLPPNCTLSGILRRGEMILPRGDTVLQAEDEVLALVDDAAAEELARLLGRPTD